MTDAVPVREFFERIIKEQDDRRNVERAADNAMVMASIKSVATALELKADAYPTIADFNDLKSRVDVVIALWKVIAGLSVVGGLVVAIYSTWK